MRTSSVRVLLLSGDLHLACASRSGRSAASLEQFGHFRRELGEILADRPIEIDPEQRRGGAVRQIDAAAAIEPDDPGRNAGQHRLGEAAPLVEFAVGLDQLALLALDLVRSSG